MPWGLMLGVGYHYQVLPAIPLCQPPKTTHVLALSQSRARLIAINQYYAEELPLEDTAPISLALATGRSFDEPVRFRSPVSSADSAAHRRDTGRGDDSELESYCRALSYGVDIFMRGTGDPALILAGDARLMSLYAHNAPHDIADVVTGNFDRSSLDELQTLARERLERLGDETLDDLSARYELLESCKQASADDQEVLAAARSGRVSELMVKADSWPTMDLPDDAKPADGHCNRACIATLKFGGKVSFVDDARFPGGNKSMAAIYRY
jgi:hypothetical protein